MTAATITDQQMTQTADKLSGVVDLLVDAGSTEQVVEIPVDQVHEHPRNPKGRTRDVDDLAAGIKDVGINNPLIVATAAAYNAGALEGDPRMSDETHFVIVGGGHRRRAAAIKAGLATVPCIVRDHLADAKGRRAALLENLHRKQLDAFEEASAFEELICSYKMSQSALAEVVGCRQPHISKRLKLLKLPSTVRAAVGTKSLSIEDAIEFARIADQGPIFDAAWAAFNNAHWMTAKDACDRAVRDHERKVKSEKAREEFKAAGVRVLDRRPLTYMYSAKEPVRLEVTGLNAAKHAAEPCHAGGIDDDGAGIFACSEPARHLPSGKSKLKLTKAKQSQIQPAGSGQSDADKAKRRLMKQLRDIRGERRTFVTELLAQPDRLAGQLLEDFDLLALKVFAHGMTPRIGIAMPLLGSEDQGEHGYYHSAFDPLIGKRSPALLRIALAAAAIENAMTDTWRRWEDVERSYLELLTRVGRPIADPEHERLGDSRDADGTWKVKAAAVAAATDADLAKCRICGCSDVEGCAGGCAWVEPDLCSTCADAVDAGLVDGEQSLVEGAG